MRGCNGVACQQVEEVMVVQAVMAVMVEFIKAESEEVGGGLSGGN